MEGKEPQQGKKTRKHPVLRGVLIAFIAVWAVLLAVLQVALNSKVLGQLLRRVATEYVDGDVQFSHVHASVLRSFPLLNVSVDDFSITYPHSRFAAWDSLTPPTKRQPSLYEAGCGMPPDSAAADTLLRFDRLSVSLNILPALKGKIHLRKATLSHPRIFAHQFDSTQANWNLFKVSSSDADTTQLVLPPLSVGKISLADTPYLVFTSLQDTVCAAVAFEHAQLKGHLGTEGVQSDEPVTLDIASALTASMPSFGEMTLPVGLHAEITPQLDSNALTFNQLILRLSTLEIEGKGRIAALREGFAVQADAALAESGLQELADTFSENFPTLKNLKTNAKLSAGLHADGILDPAQGRWPDVDAQVRIPQSDLQYKGVPGRGTIALDASAILRENQLDARVPGAKLRFAGMDFSLTGAARDLLEEDPLLQADCSLHMQLDSLVKFLPDSLQISASGDLDGKLDGQVRLSKLQSLDLQGDELSGTLTSNGIRIVDARDTISAFLGRTTLQLGPRSGKNGGFSADVDSLRATYGLSTFIHGAGLHMLAYGDASVAGRPVAGQLDIASISMMDTDSCQVRVKDSRNQFRIGKALLGKDDGKGTESTRVTLTSANQEIAVRQGVNRFSVQKASLSATAAKSQTVDVKHVPTASGDSTRLARRRQNLPDYLSDRELWKKDIDIRLGGSMEKYYKEWAFSGSLEAASGTVITPYFPLENTLSALKAKFTNDRVEIIGGKVRSGRSDLAVTGSVSGLKRALTGRGKLTLDAALRSDRIDVDQLLGAAAAGSAFVPEGTPAALDSIADKEYMKDVLRNADGEAAVAEITALIIPANLDAKVSVQANTLQYGELETSWLSSDIVTKGRCLQVTNTMAMTNMGEAFLEGFYSTKTRDDLKAGFDLTLSNITAEKVIRLFPAVDSILPMLKSFQGLLDCEMAATTSLEQDMSLRMPTLNGIIKIDGKDLVLNGGEDLDKLRKMLKFSNQTSNEIADMSVRGIIRDDKIEIFPFLLDIDRYTVAASGIQDFTQEFRYHISSIRSPMLFRFGVNLNGNFDDWKWKLGKARYKSRKLPSFEDEVDELRFTLFNAIHEIFEQGADQALRRTEASQEAIESRKTELDYQGGTETEELSEDERKALETMEKVTTEGVAPASTPEEAPAG